MPLHVTYKGRVVVHRQAIAGGLKLKLQAERSGDRGVYVEVTEAEWKQFGSEQYLTEKPKRPATRS
jgi:hypothetical protein